MPALMVGLSGVASSIFVFLLQIFLTIQLTKSQFGIFIYLNSLYLIGFTISLLGLNHYWIKNFQNGDSPKGPLYEISILFTLIASIIVYLLVAFIAIKMPQSHDLMSGKTLFIFTFFVLLICSVIWELYLLNNQIKQNFRIFAIGRILPNLIKFVFIFILLSYFSEFKFIAVGNALTGIFLAIALAIIVLRKKYIFEIYSSNYRKIIDLSRHYFIEVRSLSLFDIFWIVSMQLPILLFYALKHQDDLANLGVALIIFNGAFIFPNTISSKYLYPLLNVKIFNIKEIIKITALLGVLGLIFGIICIVFSDLLINLIFPNIYLDSASILKILGLWLPLKVLTGFISNILIKNGGISFVNYSYLTYITFVVMVFLYLKDFLDSFFILIVFPISECILLAFLGYKLAEEFKDRNNLSNT